MWMERVSVYLLVSLVSVRPGCQFPQDWLGAWHHLGYDDPINVTTHNIDYKVEPALSVAEVDLILLHLTLWKNSQHFCQKYENREF